MTDEGAHQLTRWAAQLGYRCNGSPAFGWHAKTVGCTALDPRGTQVWIKYARVAKAHAQGREWEGEVAANGLGLPFKPRLLDVHTRSLDDNVERLFVSEHAVDQTAGRVAWELTNPLLIDRYYLAKLADALAAIATIPTDRVNTRYDLVRRRVSERWGIPVQEADCSWETIHGDLHWANLTAPRLQILDWEGWGRGLYGQDVAQLMAFSSLYPTVMQALGSTFEQLARSRSFALAMMFVTAELMRMIDAYGDHPVLASDLRHLGEQARRAWIY